MTSYQHGHAPSPTYLSRAEGEAERAPWLVMARDEDEIFMRSLGRTRRPLQTEWSPSTLVPVEIDPKRMEHFQ
jgi:hypothetical protein